MKRSPVLLASTALLLLAVMLSASGCAKKVSPPPAAGDREEAVREAPAVPSPAPTITLTASPSAIEKGQSTTLSWRSTNATGVNITGGIGTVEASGSRTVSPGASTTYTARATGPGGDAVAEARVTVSAPVAVTPPPSAAVSDAAFFEAAIKDVFFGLDEYSINEDARRALAANARALAERPGIRVTIEGHCDERGSEKYNLALGDRRANSARDFLISQGIDSARIDTISYGEERPFCEETDEECWQLNRRAHFVMR